MMNERAYRRFFSRSGLRLFACTMILYAIQIAFVVFFDKTGIITEWNFDLEMAVSMIPTYAIGYPVSLLIMGDGVDKRTIEKRKMRPIHFVVTFLMAYAILMLGSITGQIVTFGIGVLKGVPVVDSLQDLMSNTNLWITSIYTVLLAPICEELLFRKFLCDRLVKYGQGTTVLLSGLLFGLFHGNFNQLFYAFFLGSFFAFIYIKTGNIRYTIGLHMIVNFFGSVVSVLFLRYVDLENLTPITTIAAVFYAVLIYGMIISGVVLLIINHSKLKLDEQVNVYEDGRRKYLALVNVGMIIYYAFFLFEALYQAFFV